jgi:uncharacterized coiled-coil DUF342 family protein
MKKETEQAINNLNVIVSNSRLTRQEHLELINNIEHLKKQCELAEKLESEKDEKKE